ncbi:GNAT family N-acetyltransferase [Mangrovivirga cuniculi]|uniref:GNAT family N-acetyltransferase n=1 Tax=Mangrovivirga cuniculi TaxID=2715131 RepID=A0A4D7JGQ3_9BACT|nr:GNAT family N-acetyltransferase [Mangrovivirga cuniculi]QCK14273.1 GNAT family N-acetyltransferase [Mangrovivirga cuniculi]
MNNFKIRKALVEDLNAIIEMLADDDLGNKREDINELTPYLSAYLRIYSDPNQELMVMTDYNQKVIGTFQLTMIPYLTYQGGIRAQIEAVRVNKDYRGQGFGQKMFNWAIERAKINGAHLIQLTTDKNRIEALEFYKSLGFINSHEGMKLHFT